MIAKTLLLCSLLIAATACGGDASNGLKPVEVSAAAQKLALTKDPGASISVKQALEQGASQSPVIVEGRVQDVTHGFALLKLMDTAIPYCGETRTNNCETPWDYCCETPETRHSNSLLVEFRDEDGLPIETDGLPNTRLLDRLKVRGKLTTNEQGNAVLAADGLWRVERPSLPSFVKWPEPPR